MTKITAATATELGLEAFDPKTYVPSAFEVENRARFAAEAPARVFPTVMARLDAADRRDAQDAFLADLLAA